MEYLNKTAQQTVQKFCGNDRMDNWYENITDIFYCTLVPSKFCCSCRLIIIGHAYICRTLQIYAHSFQSAQVAAMDAVAEALQLTQSDK